MIVYKVVKVTNGKLSSALLRKELPLERRISCLKYSEGKVTQPKFGKIFAFDSLSHARMFSDTLHDTEVWEASVLEAEQITIVASDSTGCLSRFKRFWSDRDLEENETMIAPDGTVVCPELTLVRKTE